MDSLDHPAAMSAIACFRAGGSGEGTAEPYLVVVREDVAAVALRDAQSRCVIMVNKVEGQWETPQMVTVGVSPRAAPDRNFRPSFIQRLEIHRSGPPTVDGGPPDSSWITVSGFAASGARSIAVASSLDRCVADVADDGFVLAVLRSPWREKPAVVVAMSDGRRIPCAHPSLG
ncbi:hypothetical protein [Rhodococcus tibetensis]|uniref:Uncharacterized protein n=1 Tax=Rhodococcus tibetensis TaxID=2965064 RepID=A0ABT1QBC5_9NOCA|nr:hypothetical protein [Rhodococcus sp. FXJ9.536]MCQ4119569.1 hypothetical protein [Rhodococcus sp. FXJ9.536]